jgi:hypothetical protein
VVDPNVPPILHGVPNQRSSWYRRFEHALKWLDGRKAILIPASGFLALFSGAIGVGAQKWSAIFQGASGGWFDLLCRSMNLLTICLYEAVQVPIMNLSVPPGESNFFIGLARIAGTAFFGLIAVEAIRKLFHRSFDELTLYFKKNEVSLISGLGRLGLAIAKEEGQQGKRVIVQERDEHNWHRTTAEEAGCMVLQEDANDEESLRRHIARRPTSIHLVTGDDLVNLNALESIRKIRKEYLQRHQKSAGNCDCYIHIERPLLHHAYNLALLQANRQMDDDPGLNVQVFNIQHETACQLIIDELTPIRPKTTDEVALYVVVGFGQMGMAMVKELVEFAHFENLKRSRILVLGSDPEQDYRRCISQWPRMAPREVHAKLSEVVFGRDRRDSWESQAAKPEIDQGVAIDPKAVQYAANVQFCQLQSKDGFSIDEVKELVRLCGEPGVCPVVLFCHDDDAENFRGAAKLENLLQDQHGINRPRGRGEGPNQAIPIYCFLPDSPPLRQTLKMALSGNPDAIRSFGEVEHGMRRAHDAVVDEVALEIARYYDFKKWSDTELECRKAAAIANNQPAATVQPPKEEEWEFFPIKEYRRHYLQKPFWEQVSNLNAAEHKRVTIQILGWKMASTRNEPATNPVDFDQVDDYQKIVAAKMEHHRWMAERLLMGWSYSPQRSDHPPTRPSMCARKHLTEVDWVKDYKQIDAALKYFEEKKIPFRRIS